VLVEHGVCCGAGAAGLWRCECVCVCVHTAACVCLGFALLLLQVFISEQVLYSKADLERHYRTGDDAGPLAEAGFKGHPLCRFCKKRFYDGDELYRHMENSHEHCFLCRKLHPNRFVYYKDYAELDGEPHGARPPGGGGVWGEGAAKLDEEPHWARVWVWVWVCCGWGLNWTVSGTGHVGGGGGGLGWAAPYSLQVVAHIPNH
jgi:hypothetical protein